MSEINHIPSLFPANPASSALREHESSRTRLGVPTRDTVEFSHAGMALARAVEDSSLSLARTRVIRAEIHAGTFETPARIEGTVERLLDVIG